MRAQGESDRRGGTFRGYRGYYRGGDTPLFRGRAVGVTHHFLPLLGGISTPYLPPIYPLCAPLSYHFSPKSALLARRPRALPLRRTPAERPPRVSGGLPAVAPSAPKAHPQSAGYRRRSAENHRGARYPPMGGYSRS